MQMHPMVNSEQRHVSGLELYVGNINVFFGNTILEFSFISASLNVDYVYRLPLSHLVTQRPSEHIFIAVPHNFEYIRIFCCLPGDRALFNMPVSILAKELNICEGRQILSTMANMKFTLRAEILSDYRPFECILALRVPDTGNRIDLYLPWMDAVSSLKRTFKLAIFVLFNDLRRVIDRIVYPVNDISGPHLSMSTQQFHYLKITFEIRENPQPLQLRFQLQIGNDQDPRITEHNENPSKKRRVGKRSTLQNKPDRSVYDEPVLDDYSSEEFSGEQAANDDHDFMFADRKMSDEDGSVSGQDNDLTKSASPSSSRKWSSSVDPLR